MLLGKCPKTGGQISEYLLDLQEKNEEVRLKRENMSYFMALFIAILLCHH
jgi:hypothetical protein